MTNSEGDREFDTRDAPTRCVSTAGAASDLAQQLTGLYDRADPLADSAVNALLNHGFSAGMRALALALAGDRSVDLPPPVQALVDTAFRHAADFDQATLERGAAAFAGLGFQPIMTALGLGSLMTTYASPAFTHQLTRSGNLVRMAPRRLIETGGWLAACLQPGGLRPGAPGFRISIHVRLVHAKMRLALGARDWDYAHWGAPLSQFDQLHGILVFSFVAIRSLERIGLRIDDKRITDVYAFWRAVGVLLGVEAIDLVASHAEARRLHDAIEVMNGQPIADAAKLALALLDVFDARATEGRSRLTGMLGKELARSLCHRFLGSETAERLGVAAPRWPSLANCFGATEGIGRSFASPAARASRARQEFQLYLDEHFPAKNVTDRVLAEAT